jgi:MYXO-CTERM domain-containing protein
MPSPFTLEDGESMTFKAFDIWTNETSLNDDDYCEQPISATFNFSAPLSSGTVTGETDGKSDYFLFIFKYEKGVLEWDCPTVVDLGCVVYEIALSDAKFNKGLWGLSEGECYGATIYATVKQISSGDCVVAPTPTAAAAGLAMLGGLVFRRRRAA